MSFVISTFAIFLFSSNWLLWCWNHTLLCIVSLPAVSDLTLTSKFSCFNFLLSVLEDLLWVLKSSSKFALLNLHWVCTQATFSMVSVLPSINSDGLITSISDEACFSFSCVSRFFLWLQSRKSSAIHGFRISVFEWDLDFTDVTVQHFSFPSHLDSIPILVSYLPTIELPPISVWTLTPLDLVMQAFNISFSDLLWLFCFAFILST